MYLSFYFIHIPYYGFFIALGLLMVNIIAYIKLKPTAYSYLDFIIFESFLLLGAIIGAKLIYLLTIMNQIDFTKLIDINYLNTLMSYGFVFYGGLIGAIISAYLFRNLYAIPIKWIFSHFTYLIPLAHAFGRLGCFKAGCCYGIEYHGIGSIIYHYHSLAPYNVSLFPVQLVESIALFILSFILYKQTQKHASIQILYNYLISYSIIRFILEFVRNDSIRGISILSTSQYISLFIILILVIKHIKETKRNKIF